MFPDYHFPPALSQALRPHSQQMALSLTSNPNLKPSGLNYISLWCFHLQIYLPDFPILDLSLPSWMISSYSGWTPPPLLLASSQLEDTASILASLSSVSAFYCWWSLSPWGAVCSLSHSTLDFHGAVFSWVLLVSYLFLVPFKVSSSPCSFSGTSQMLFLTPAALISLSSSLHQRCMVLTFPRLSTFRKPSFDLASVPFLWVSIVFMCACSLPFLSYPIEFVSVLVCLPYHNISSKWIQMRFQSSFSSTNYRGWHTTNPWYKFGESFESEVEKQCRIYKALDLIFLVNQIHLLWKVIYVLLCRRCSRKVN